MMFSLPRWFQTAAARSEVQRWSSGADEALLSSTASSSSTHHRRTPLALTASSHSSPPCRLLMLQRMPLKMMMMTTPDLDIPSPSLPCRPTRPCAFAGTAELPFQAAFTLWRHCCHMGIGYRYKASCARPQVKPSFVIFDIWAVGTLTLGAERQSTRMPKITNDCLTWSGTGCFIAVPIWQPFCYRHPHVLITVIHITIGHFIQIG